MKVLVFYDTEIKTWLTNEKIESTEEFIKNGYPHLMDAWLEGTLKAEVIDVPEEYAFSSDKHKVVGGTVVRA